MATPPPTVARPGPRPGIRLATTAEVLMGAALEGRSTGILYRWPVAAGLGPHRPLAGGAGGWPGFSKGVRYARGSALGVGEAASLLDVPSHGPGPADRWVLLCQA